MIGRPPKYKTPEELEERISEYFGLLQDGKRKRLCIPGLIAHLGFCDRSTFYKLENKSEAFGHIIKKARLRLEEQHTERGEVMDIFALKQMGWSDRQEHTGPAGGPIQVDSKIEIVLTTSDRKA